MGCHPAQEVPVRTPAARPIAILSLILTACAPAAAHRATGSGGGSSAAQGDRLLLSHAGSLTEVDAGSGAVIRDLPGGVPTGDGATVFATRSEASSTVLESLDPASGRVSDVATLRGSLAIRSVSRDGTSVALTAPLPAGSTDWAPPPSRTTDIVVVRVADGSVDRLHLRGNYQPESFSTDDATLFMLSYLPPTAPTTYRVTGLYLEKRRVWDVIGPDKQPVENMTATRLQQVPAPDGSALYTLYSNQPPAYLAANGATTAEPDERAFVHTLQLEGPSGFAVCIPLPDVFGSVPAARSAIAVSPDGSKVYAVDAQTGDLATVTVARQRVHDASVDLSALGGDRTAAVVSADGSTLFVGGGGTIAVIDPVAGALTTRWGVGGSLTDLAISPDGRRLYAAFADHVAVLDASTGAVLDRIDRGGDAIAGVLSETGTP
jgi:hypothetical protein